MFCSKKPLIVLKDRKLFLQERLVEVYIELSGLRCEKAEWGRIAGRKVSINFNSNSLMQTAKKIGELEAERNLIDLELIKLHFLEKYTV